MSFPNIAVFQIVGMLSINNCIWSITGNSSFQDTPHLSIDGGSLKCNDLVVRSIDKSNFQFIVYTKNGGSIHCIGLSLLGIITSGNKLIYLNYKSQSQTNFTNSVCYFYFIFNFF
jgi:hypothetical protein